MVLARRSAALHTFCILSITATLLVSAGCRRGAEAPDDSTPSLVVQATPRAGESQTEPTPSPSSGAPSPSPAPVSDGQKLVIAWTEGEPARQLQTLCADFTQETGVPVEVQQLAPSEFETKIGAALDAKETTYDLVVGDTQSLGKAASSGQYVDLTDWAKTGLPQTDIFPAALSAYGEYPTGSGRLYAVPCMGDASVFVYRKDLFTDPKNKSAFKARYKRDLAPPKTWEEFKDLASFFTKPDGSLYGAALFYGQSADSVTMGFEPVLWSYGGKWSEGKLADGIINSPTALKALEYYVSLKKFTPPSSDTYGATECLGDYTQGKVAMAQTWFSSLAEVASKAGNAPFANETGYFTVPQGPAGQFVSLGGQGISLSASSEQPDNAKRFLEWFSKQSTQAKWARLGGVTANTKVVSATDFKQATPFNATLIASLPYAKDFYNMPEAAELLAVTQRELSAAVAGTKTPKDALDTIAKEHQAILDNIK